MTPFETNPSEKNLGPYKLPIPMMSVYVSVCGYSTSILGFFFTRVIQCLCYSYESI